MTRKLLSVSGLSVNAMGSTDADSTDDDPTVLVVEDEAAFAESAALWLEAEYDVRVANDGEAAIAAYGPAVDAVLLDRRMPGLVGDEALSRMADEHGDPGVAIVSAVEPDFDLLDLTFDFYVQKPVTKADVVGTVDRLLTVASYPDDLRDVFATVGTIEALHERYPEYELSGDERYEELVEELTAKCAAVDSDRSVLTAHDRERFRSGFDDVL